MRSPKPLGQTLLDDGEITQDQLDSALKRHDREGGHLGQQLVLEGALSRIDLAEALARQWSTPRVDLVVEPPDPQLLLAVGYPEVLREGWTPWRMHDRHLIVATTVEPHEALRQRAKELFHATTVEFRTTTAWDIWRAVEAVHRDRLLFESAEQLAQERPLASAAPGLTWWQKLLPMILLAILVIGFLLEPRTTFVVLITGANLTFASAILFKTMAAVLGPMRHRRLTRNRWAEMQLREERGLPPMWRGRQRDADLPTYTILIPVYKEANIVEKVLTNIGSLDYPKSKLDVLLLMEADDAETIAVAKAMNPPDYVRLIVVPPGSPQTKPRACNYGLAFAKGEFVVIFDAEDRPDPGQLRMAVQVFARDDFEREAGISRKAPLAVVQASLHYFNADYNVLTRMFAIEYAHWFEAMLPGMGEAGIPLPLGGTSNHFRTTTLRSMGAWDPYNVTEDADAGLRAAVLGYRVEVMNSTTGEEACAETRAWIKQRTRWIKGYMLTAAVNTRQPLRFARNAGPRGVITMVGLIMATPVAFLAYPLALAFTIVTYVGVQIIGLNLPNWVSQMSITTFVFGNVLMIVSAGIAATWRYNWRIGIFAIFYPVYWLLHSVAAWRALFQVVRDPHKWEKTPHGLTENYESDAHV